MALIKKIFETEIKAFDDKSLTIEHFISTEQEDRSKDIVRADGMEMDGIPVVLKQHGFDTDTGHEPIAKPLSIIVGVNSKGVKGIIAKTQYFDGSKLTPPDNTGQRLYQKAKERFMPYFSIGFSALDASPRPGGGVEFKKWRLNEYSQVGVPDNIGAEVIKTMAPEEVEKTANEILTYAVEKEEIIIPEPVKKTSEEAINDALQITAKRFECTVDELIKMFSLPETQLKTIAERVAQDLPWEAMRTLWFGMLDELYVSDGTEKVVKAIIKEFSELVTPYAVSFAQSTGGAEIVEMKNLIESKTYIDVKEVTVVPAPVVPVNKDTSPVILRLLPEPPALKLPDGLTKEDIAKAVKEAVKDGVKKSLDVMKGKITV